MMVQALTTPQILWGIGVYFFMTLLWPAALLGQTISHIRFRVRFLIYQTIGNFYMMSLALLLGVAHIYHCGMLILATMLPILTAFVIRWKGRRSSVHVPLWFGNISRKCIWGNLFEGLLVFAVMAAVSAQGQRSVEGPYPFGIRGVADYLHVACGIEAAVWEQGFWAAQTITLCFVLLAFIRLCCKLRYLPYAGMCVYFLLGFYWKSAYPFEISLKAQEFGMIFILLSAAFLFLFFEGKQRELNEAAESSAVCRGKEWQEAGHAPDEKERVYLLDEVLAESVAREEAGRAETYAPDEDTQNETVLIMEESPAGGAMSIKECPLDGTFSIKDSSMEEIVGHASEEIQLLDTDYAQNERRGGNSAGSFHALRQNLSRESVWYLALFTLSFSMALAVHVENGLVAGIFCMSVLAGYSFRLVKKQYLGRILMAVLLACALALPIAMQGYVTENLDLRPLMQPGVNGISRLTWITENAYLPDAEHNWLKPMIFLTMWFVGAVHCAVIASFCKTAGGLCGTHAVYRIFYRLHDVLGFCVRAGHLEGNGCLGPLQHL